MPGCGGRCPCVVCTCGDDCKCKPGDAGCNPCAALQTGKLFLSLAEVLDVYQAEKAALGEAGICEEVDVPEVLEMLQGGSGGLIDVRSENQRAVSTVAGSLNQPDGSTVKELITLCATGSRAAEEACRLMRENPELRVRVLRGGIAAWVHAEQCLVDSDGVETRTIGITKMLSPFFPGDFERVLVV
eukprot:TRINITY_DN19007_c0_g1_i1.p2 TRINITY_DN19007_c0_g1~~TRINITY_DN19007_c0_g1_i1.p2  ORF type:complete len:186 (-),score=31.12 TRINITY_DN19007_c0_g1_i1:267-824(-)